MSYKIPKNLKKYSESFLWGISFKQFGYIGGAALGIMLIFLKLEVSLIYRILLSVPVFILGMLLSFGKIDEKWFKEKNYRNSLKDVSYNNPKIDSIIPIKEISDDVVFLKNGKMLAVLKALPINFSILSDEQQDYVLNIYRNWLRSLDGEVQITCRSVDLKVDTWFDLLKDKKNVKQNNKRFNSMKKWMNNFIEKNKVRNRVFYITIPLHAVIKKKKRFSLKNILIGSSFLIDKEDESYKNALRELEDKINNCIETLSPSGIDLKRVGTNELLGLYSSYFTNASGGGKSYLTPVMWPNKEVKL